MKKYLVLLLLAFITSFSFCQTSSQDTVYLKDEDGIEDKATFQEKGNNTPDEDGFQKRFKGIIEVGYGLGLGNYGWNRLKLNVIYGYQINPHVFLGLGTGLRYYFETEGTLIPIFADFRMNLMNSNVSPYISLDAGYTFDTTNDFKGVGILIAPTAGISFKVSDKSSMNIGIGYEIQRMKIINYYYEEHTQESGVVTINIGIPF